MVVVTSSSKDTAMPFYLEQAPPCCRVVVDDLPHATATTVALVEATAEAVAPAISALTTTETAAKATTAEALAATEVLASAEALSTCGK